MKSARILECPAACRPISCEAGKVTEELARRGIPPKQHLHVIVESVGEDDIAMTAINAAGGAFDWLADEPDLYTDEDLVERYR